MMNQTKINILFILYTTSSDYLVEYLGKENCTVCVFITIILYLNDVRSFASPSINIILIFMWWLDNLLMFISYFFQRVRVKLTWSVALVACLMQSTRLPKMTLRFGSCCSSGIRSVK